MTKATFVRRKPATLPDAALATSHLTDVKTDIQMYNMFVSLNPAAVYCPVWFYPFKEQKIIRSNTPDSD